MKERILVYLGLALLVGGTALHIAADRLSRNYIQRDARSSSWTTDTRQKDSLEFVGDRLSLLGVGLLVVGAFGWMNARTETRA